MEKRGQVTLFVVIGLVLLFTIILFFYARTQYGFTVPTAQYLSAQLLPIEENIQTCMDKELLPGAQLLGEQGGTFTPIQFIHYKNRDVKIVCATLPGNNQCINLLQPFSSLETDLQNYFHFKLDNCIDRGLVKNKGYTPEGSQQLNVTVDARASAIKTTVQYDLTLVKDDQRVRVPQLTKVLKDTPLHDLYTVAVDIVNSEALTGTFDNLGYMLAHKGRYVIVTDKPFPNKVYKITAKDSTYEYWIAVKGEV